jgi:F-type H+-transporting ATPase subunit b
MSFLFILSHEHSLFNFNLFETNIINILLVIGLLIYANKVSFAPSLNQRKDDIIESIEKAQKDLLQASKYYYLSEKAIIQSTFWIQSWQKKYEKEKLSIVDQNYKSTKDLISDNFSTTKSLIKNIEKKYFLSIQKYLGYVLVSRILQKFFSLSEKEQSKIIEATILRLGGNSK